MKLTVKDKEFLERLKPLFDLKDLDICYMSIKIRKKFIFQGNTLLLVLG